MGKKIVCVSVVSSLLCAQLNSAHSIMQDHAALQSMLLAVPLEIQPHVTKIRTSDYTNLSLFILKCKAVVILKS